MLLVGTSVGGFAYPSNCYAATESSSEQSIYSLANHYFKIKSISNGKYLLGNKAGYEALGSKSIATSAEYQALAADKIFTETTPVESHEMVYAIWSE